MHDEYEESEKRRMVMDERIQSLRKKHGLLRGLHYMSIIICYNKHAMGCVAQLI